MAAADDDAALVKKMGQSFRFSAVSVIKVSFIALLLLYLQNSSNLYLLFHFKARKEEEMKALHDDAIFGVSSHPLPPAETDDKAQGANHEDENVETAPAPSLLSNQVNPMHNCTLQGEESNAIYSSHGDKTSVSAGFNQAERILA